jgi:hypothetical protein
MYNNTSLSCYTVKNGRYTYIVNVLTKRDFKSKKPISYNIDVGGRMKGCVTITVEAPELHVDPRFAFLEASKLLAFMSWIGYNPKCNINTDDPLAKGSGTRHMLTTAMAYVLQQYDWIKGFRFDDMSTIVCGNRHVSLPHISIATHGQTYYEKTFHAQLEDDVQMNEYQNKIAMMHDPNMKPPIQYALQGFCKPDWVYVIYKEAKTISEFFIGVKQFSLTNETITFCEIMDAWGNAILDKFFNIEPLVMHNKWKIENRNNSLNKRGFGNLEITTSHCFNNRKLLLQ